MSSFVSDLIESFAFVERQQGRRSAVVQSVRFLFSSLFTAQRAFALRKELQDLPPLPNLEPEFCVREATLDDEALLGTIVPLLRVKRFLAKMRAGEVCVLALHQGRAVGQILAALTGTPTAEEWLRPLAPTEAYLWGAYAVPEYRRQGIVRAVNLTLCHLLQERGYRSTVLLVERNNQPALRHCRNLGYCVTHEVTYVRVLRWHWGRTKPISDPGPC